jgi:hypothetical protein|nr:MAG TPA: Stress-induced bacterial acidophilic repeat motif [Caudoviricetes sp.]DAO24621.1 MAG TPA: Stress-induced bacterial acidophilic repeat motif [Caudoviricetes sp.]
MPNERNLIPMEKRSPEEAREMGRKGGRASGEARRRKKSLREAAELYLSLPVSDKRKWNKLSEDGVPPEDVNNQMAIIAGLSIKAAKGDAKAAKVLFDLLPTDGADPLEQAEDDPITKSLKEEAENGLL